MCAPAPVSPLESHRTVSEDAAAWRGPDGPPRRKNQGFPFALWGRIGHPRYVARVLRERVSRGDGQCGQRRAARVDEDRGAVRVLASKFRAGTLARGRSLSGIRPRQGLDPVALMIAHAPEGVRGTTVRAACLCRALGRERACVLPRPACAPPGTFGIPGSAEVSRRRARRSELEASQGRGASGRPRHPDGARPQVPRSPLSAAPRARNLRGRDSGGLCPCARTPLRSAHTGELPTT